MHFVRVCAVVVSFCTAVLLAGSGSALAGQSPGTYTLVISPASVSGGTSTTFKFALKNLSSSSSRLESANFIAPAGFSLRAAALPEGQPGTASLLGNVVALRGLTLKPGSVLDVSVTAVAACRSALHTWGSAADTDSNLTGRPLTLGASQSSLTTTVAAACALSFATQPHNAVVGQDITGSAFNPIGAPVTVNIVNSKGNVVSSSSAPVTIALGNNPSGATLGGTTTEDAVNGVATFSDLKLNQPGNGYTLVASSPSLTDATSNPFDEADTVATCLQGQSCSTSLSTSVSQLQVTANPAANPNVNSGTLTESVDVGTPLTCAGYEAVDPNWYESVMSTSNRVKVITYTLDNTSPEGIQFCFGAPYEFTTSSGGPAPAGTLPDGTPGFIGLLPSCPASGPCVESITSSEGNEGANTIITVRIPDGLPGDPYMRM
jgi:hypothetical protein